MRPWEYFTLGDLVNYLERSSGDIIVGKIIAIEQRADKNGYFTHFASVESFSGRVDKVPMHVLTPEEQHQMVIV